MPLVRDPAMVERIGEMFARRGREMAESNLRQADRPEGAEFVLQERAPPPGWCARPGGQVVYAVPGVPGGDAGDGRAGRDPRPAAAGGAPVGDRQPDAADVGGGRVDPGRAGRRAGRPPDEPHHRLPRRRDRGDQGAAHGQGRRREARPRPCSTPRRPSCGRSSATWCSASTTRRWSRRWPTCCWSAGADAGRGRVADRRAGRGRGWPRCRGPASGSGARSWPTTARSSSTCWACPKGRW